LFLKGGLAAYDADGNLVKQEARREGEVEGVAEFWHVQAQGLKPSFL
jgi:hypothetical protein